MRTLFVSLFFYLSVSIFIPTLVFGQETKIAHCENPQGKSYFPYLGLVQEKDAGWDENGISNGIFELIATDEKLDVRYVDSANRIMSSVGDGGEVIILNRGSKEFSILVYYPQNAIETYTLYLDNNNKNQFMMTQVKGGDNAPITQASIYTGKCDFIEFDPIAHYYEGEIR